VADRPIETLDWAELGWNVEETMQSVQAAAGSVAGTDPVRDRVAALKAVLSQRLIASDSLVERLLIALLAGGHVLIEGAPGLAKTRAVKLLAKAIAASFGRIQCTPDLMPADLTGTPVWRPDRGQFEFVAGPIFHSLALVDEINRAPPKVQSALLEAMAELQVSSAGVTHRLPDPFIVVATQNPIEQEGTFPLPEAQLDRFLVHILVHLPDARAEREILDLVEGETVGDESELAPLINVADILSARARVQRIFLSPAIKDYIVRLVTAPRSSAVAADIARLIAHPASPRGTLALAAAAKARAYLHGRDHVVPEDVADLAGDILAHRTILTWRAAADGETARGVIGRLLAQIQPL
jgi:MoxR-like ATPase